MAYNRRQAQRIRMALSQFPEIQEKEMFGGVAFLVQGNMACGIHGEELIVRVGKESYSEALRQPYTHPFDLTGKPMSGWIMVALNGYLAEDDLQRWIDQGLEFARALPGK